MHQSILMIFSKFHLIYILHFYFLYDFIFTLTVFKVYYISCSAHVFILVDALYILLMNDNCDDN